MGGAPLLASVAHDLGIKGIGADLAAVVINAAPPLAFRLVAKRTGGTKQ
jgi:hypothetical protein